MIIYLLKSFYVTNRSYHIPETIARVDVANMFMSKCPIFFGAASPCQAEDLLPGPFAYIFFVAAFRPRVASYQWYGSRTNNRKLGKLYMVFKSAKFPLHFTFVIDWQTNSCGFATS